MLKFTMEVVTSNKDRSFDQSLFIGGGGRNRKICELCNGVAYRILCEPNTAEFLIFTGQACKNGIEVQVAEEQSG